MALCFLVLQLSYHVVTCLNMAASTGDAPPSDNFLKNLRQGHLIGPPPLRESYLDNLPQSPHVEEDRYIEVDSPDALVKKVALALKFSLNFPEHEKAGLLDGFRSFLLKKVNNVHKATVSFRSNVRDSLKMNSPDYTEFLKWCVAIERSLPGRPEKAYAIMSVVLSKELGNWHAARVLVGLKEINLFRSQKVFQALLHLWQIKELNLAALLSEVELGLLDTPNKVIETFLNPVFAECFEYAYDMERAGKESVYDSLMVVLKQYNLDSQMDNIIAAGVERLHHAVTSEVEKLRRILHYLVFQLNKKTNPIPILESFIIPHGSSNAISRTYDRLAKACHPHGNDEAKSEWLINSLTGSLLEPQLFVIMYKMNSKQHHTGFPAIVLKQLAKHWQESPSSSYDTALTLFQQFQFEKLPAGVKNDQYELNRLESWKAFIDLAYGKQTSIPVSLLNDIVKQGNGAVTYAMLEHIWAVVLWHEQATSAKELEKSVIL